MGKANSATIEQDEIETDGIEQVASETSEQVHGWEIRRTDVQLGKNAHGFTAGLSIELHRNGLENVFGFTERLVADLVSELRESDSYKNFIGITTLASERREELREVNQEESNATTKIADLQKQIATDPGAMDELREALFQQSASSELASKLRQELKIIEESVLTAREALLDTVRETALKFRSRVLAMHEAATNKATAQVLESIDTHLDELFHSQRACHQLAKWQPDVDNLLKQLEEPQS